LEQPLHGAVAKWQGEGLQNLYRQFDPAPRLQIILTADPFSLYLLSSPLFRFPFALFASLARLR
jgi:hypothetical protein